MSHAEVSAKWAKRAPEVETQLPVWIKEQESKGVSLEKFLAAGGKGPSPVIVTYDQISAYERACSEALRLAIEIDREHDGTKAECASWKTKAEALEAEAEALKTELEALKKEKATLQGTSSSVSALAEKHKAEIVRLQAQLTAETGRANTAQQRVEAERARAASTQGDTAAQLAKARDEAGQLAEENEELQQALQASQERVTEAEGLRQVADKLAEAAKAATQAFRGSEATCEGPPRHPIRNDKREQEALVDAIAEWRVSSQLSKKK